jgi:hypothetical protein
MNTKLGKKLLAAIADAGKELVEKYDWKIGTDPIDDTFQTVLMKHIELFVKPSLRQAIKAAGNELVIEYDWEVFDDPHDDDDIFVKVLLKHIKPIFEARIEQ